MVLCRPFLVELEFGNVVFEEMVDEMIRSTKKKPQGSIEGSAPKLNFLWRLTSVFTTVQPRQGRAVGWEGLGGFSLPSLFPKRQTDR